MAWSKNGTPTTLDSASGTIEISDLTGKKSNSYIYHLLDDNTNQILEFAVYNSETGNLFSSRHWFNGTESTDASRDEIISGMNGVQDLFGISYSVWVSGQEKLTIGFSVGRNTAGSSNITNRAIFVGKYCPSSLTDTFDVLTLEAQSGGSNYQTGSNVSAFGTD